MGAVLASSLSLMLAGASATSDAVVISGVGVTLGSAVVVVFAGAMVEFDWTRSISSSSAGRWIQAKAPSAAAAIRTSQIQIVPCSGRDGGLRGRAVGLFAGVIGSFPLALSDRDPSEATMASASSSR